MRGVLGVLFGLGSCDGDWQGDVYAYQVAVCEWQARCAESVAGLDCEAYADQLEVRADPCLTYDGYYMEACLTQMEDQLARLDLGQAACQTDPQVEAPACGQAMVRVAGGVCPDVTAR